MTAPIAKRFRKTSRPLVRHALTRSMIYTLCVTNLYISICDIQEKFRRAIWEYEKRNAVSIYLQAYPSSYILSPCVTLPIPSLSSFSIIPLLIQPPANTLPA
ncbi:hypothetical protein CJF30_00009047 [Rutstroemia sp. NJR-2017a BBW]|nr:hypothetical protein CJF30_00009047 [Rutstroemia sp. NJR-2017a BBW]